MKTRGRKTTPKARRDLVGRWALKKSGYNLEYDEFSRRPAVSRDNQNPPAHIRSAIPLDVAKARLIESLIAKGKMQ